MTEFTRVVVLVMVALFGGLWLADDPSWFRLIAVVSAIVVSALLAWSDHGPPYY